MENNTEVFTEIASLCELSNGGIVKREEPESIELCELAKAQAAETLTSMPEIDLGPQQPLDEEDDEDSDSDMEEEILSDGAVDNEVEEHVMSAHVAKDINSQAELLQASKSVLFRRYSRLKPEDVEVYERSKEDIFRSPTTVDAHTSLMALTICPDPLAEGCQNPDCQELMRWKDSRISELQAALDHMTEAMAIQQRDMSAQRVFLSRQSEQLTKLSMSLHQEKTALLLERERFQKHAATALPMLKTAIKTVVSPVVSPSSSNRRSTVGATKRMSSAAIKLYTTSYSGRDKSGDMSRTASSTNLRMNPLISEAQPLVKSGPLNDRCSSMTVLDRRVSEISPVKRQSIACTSNEQQVISLLSQKDSAPSLETVDMADINLNDGTTSTCNTDRTSSTSVTDFCNKRSEFESSQPKSKLTISERFKSLRWRS